MNHNEFNNFLLKGSLALNEASCFGMRVDEKHVRIQMKKCERRIQLDRREVFSSEEGKTWRKLYGDKMNVESSAQLGRLLFKEMNIEPVARTPKGAPKTDFASLNELSSSVPFLNGLMGMRKRIKTFQYFSQINREMVDGFIHPAFHVHRVRTYRSSSSGPNFQNLPIRDPEQSGLIRKCFIPRNGRQIMEVDYGGIEVKVAACYHKDPVMLKYLHDPTKDLHRDMAAECYKLDNSEVSKAIRYCGKNKFVFPQFYGSWWKECAENLWTSVKDMNLKTESGVPLKEHLQNVGLGNLSDFSEHIKRVERGFWGRRFRVYDSWKRRWYKEYLKNGFIEGKTGFICSNAMSRNDCINYPVQGAAFHCLLWSFIESVKGFRKMGLSQSHVGQIHDSIVLDVVPEEREVIIEYLNNLMVNKIREFWKWVIVPMEVEFELTPIGSSWLEKEKYELEVVK